MEGYNDEDGEWSIKWAMALKEERGGEWIRDTVNTKKELIKMYDFKIHVGWNNIVTFTVFGRFWSLV